MFNVSPVPDVHVEKIEDSFQGIVVMASDGLWKVLDEKKVSEELRKLEAANQQAENKVR